jgi:hypothetical protein
VASVRISKTPRPKLTILLNIFEVLLQLPCSLFKFTSIAVIMADEGARQSLLSGDRTRTPQPADNTGSFYDNQEPNFTTVRIMGTLN